MIDPKVLRENPELVRESQRRRGESVAVVDRVLELDQRKRELQQEFDRLRNEQKLLSKEIGSLQGQVRNSESGNATEAEEALAQLLDHAKILAESVKEAERQASEVSTVLDSAWLEISNLVDMDAPIGGEDDFTILELVGQPRDFAAEGFTPRDHLELGELLGAIDTERGAKVSGARFFFLTGVGALLEFALLNMAIEQATSYGFTPVITPTLVLPSAMEGTGFLGQAAENVYRVEQDDMYLVGTAEVPLAGLHSQEILEASSLPVRYAGWSSCFRREAGSYGKDTRGIIRVHQFDKVEMFSYCHPDQAEEEHRRLLSWEKEFLNKLELPYRVIDVATGDLGSSAARKFDIEAWIPTQEKYREVTSTSNTTEFQARRLQIRMRDGDGVRPLATLNGTLCAMPRIIVALFENHQRADGSVAVPKALQPFLGGRRAFNVLV